MFNDVSEGKFDQALEMAITEDEVREIERKRAEFGHANLMVN